MGDWIDEEFERLREKRDLAHHRSELFAQMARRKWQELSEVVHRDAAKIDTKLADLMGTPEASVISVMTDAEAIIIDKQAQPGYRVSLRLDLAAKSIRIERQVVAGPGNAKREVSERLALELSEAGAINISHPQQDLMTPADVSKYALLPIVTTLEKILSRK
jgi:hypothetical protein